MQECIAVRLQQVDVTNLVSVHRHVNRILLEAATAAFPKQPPADHRVSAQPAFRVTAKSVWHMYRNLKRPRVCTPHEIFAKWKLAASFARASKILRKQSQSLKKQFYESQVDQAEHAANNNDQRSLFLIIKRLSPKNRNIACRLRGSDGHLLTGPEQMQRIVAYGNETFAAKDDDHPRIPLTTALQISAQDIAQELRKLGVSKAVPRHIAPAAVWKQCSQDLGQILSHAICHHMQPGTSGELDEDWKSSYVVWIPKPGKPQLDVASLRPIGLSSPASKALAGSLRQHLLRGLEPALRTTPQFAYAKSRGTADALLRAHMHFEAVTQLVQNTQCTRFQKQAGGKEREVVGGLSLSLDLSKAFDGVTRAHIYNSMAQRGVPQDVITIIQQLHYRAQYVYQTGTQSGSTTTSNGIKQGCVIAPYLWNYFSLAYLSMLQDRRSEAWVQQVLTLFADDVWGAWEIRNARDLDQAIADVSLVLEALETLNMTINYSKTAILLKLVGKDAQRLKQQHTFMKAGQLHLRVSVHGRECGIPIKEAFISENAMRVHCGLKHESVCLHASFARGNSGGGDSEVRAPLPPDHAPAQIKQMLGHDPDYAINEEAAIFANCWPEPPEFLLSPSASLRPRGHPFGSSSFGLQRPPPQHDPLRLLTRVVLQQEQTISRLRHDKAIVLFMKQGEDGALGALMRVAKEWNNKKAQENSTVRSPLKTVLLSSMIGTLLKLAQQAVATEENKKKMVTAEWLTANSEWTYRMWNHAERRLVIDNNKTPLQHAEAVRILTFLLEHLTGEAIQRFNSTVTLPKLEQQGANIATFALEVSLRGKEAAELYHSFE
ncbi:unnamed protein product, partial [Symbiodinium sp. KB8]